MVASTKIRTPQTKSKKVRINYPLRVLGCLVVLGLHISILGETASLYIWAFAILHTLIYPHLTFVLSKTERHEDLNIVIDSFAYGCCISLWGFNALATIAFVCGSWMSNTASGGFRMLRAGVIATLVGAAITTWINGFYYRPQLELIPTFIASLGLLIYSITLGFQIFRTNNMLSKTQKRLIAQREELMEASALAHAINTSLDIDHIMERVVKALNRVYAFEQVYITLFDESRQNLIMVRSYGNALSSAERTTFEAIRFSVEQDKRSVFVAPLLKDRPLYIARVDERDVMQAADIDYDLFKIKPSKSIAYFPLHVENKVIGGIGFINYSSYLGLDEASIGRISNYLVQVGTAVRNAELYRAAREAEKKALEAQRKAEASEEAKSNFLANMSHEIRTPMTAIIGYSESLRDEQLSAEEQKEFIGTIIRSGQHLLRIINDILDLSKIEAHKLEIEHTRTSLPGLLEDVRASLAMRAREKNLDFSVSYDFPLPSHINTDPTRLKQILFNLGGNATKFTDTGSINVHVQFSKEPRRLKFEVRDTGIGLPRDKTEQIFEPFAQADSSTTRRYGGTGLGLYISRQLARMLGGDLTVESELGKGSCFTLTIDPGHLSYCLWYQSESEMHREVQLDPKRSSGTGGDLNGHVLVAEDNPENQDLLRRLLGQKGLHVTIVDNGQKALNAIAKESFDLILLDIQMPVMGGEEVAKRLQSQRCDIPIIAITANVMRHQLDQYRASGFTDVVAKPIDREKLGQTLKLYLSQQANALCGRVLVAEDNPVNRMLIERQIRKQGRFIEVVTARDGNEALVHALNQPFDLIFMDIHMPNKTGYEALTELRKKGYRQPIYMLSGDSGLENEKASLEQGADAHLSKPIDREKLEQALTQHLLPQTKPIGKQSP